MGKFLSKMKNSNAHSGRKGQLLVGVFLLLAGIALAWQPVVTAQQDGPLTWTIRSDISDIDMFGKRLSSERIRPMQAVSSLRPTSNAVLPVRLRIPALDIDTNVETVGLHKGAMDVPTNIWNVGWYSSGVKPGETGNAVIAGHKDSVHSTAIFWDLAKLKVGDQVYISDSAGDELTFEVYKLESYAAGQAPISQIFGATEEKQLNLITCDGNFVVQKATYDKRLVVYTRLVAK